MCGSVSAELAGAVAGYLDEPVDALEFARIQTGKFNTSFTVGSEGTPRWVLRVAPPDSAEFVFYERSMMKQEPAIHELLLARTRVPVPRILAFDESRTAIDRDFMVMEYLPGDPMSDGGVIDRERILFEVGECLAQAHTQTAPEYGYLGEHRPMAPQPEWNSAFWMMWRLLIEDVERTGHYSKAESQRMLRLLDASEEDFNRSVASSLLHMDVWAQNILVQSGQSLGGLLDWDRALWGDPEIEFAVLDYCGISEPAFWRGYGQERDASPEACRRNIFYLLYEIQKYIVIHHGRHGDARSARRYKDQVMGIVQEVEMNQGRP